MGYFQWLWKGIIAIAALLGVCAPVFGVAYYFYGIEGRLTSLESKVGILSAAPAIVRGPTSKSDQTFGPDFIEGNNKTPNPLIATCLDLYSRAAKAGELKDYVAQQNINGYLRELTCPDVLKATAPRK